MRRALRRPSIRVSREALGWSQRDLAAKAGLWHRTVAAVESGRPCRQDTRRKLLRALGVPWEFRDEYFARDARA